MRHKRKIYFDLIHQRMARLDVSGPQDLFLLHFSLLRDLRLFSFLSGVFARQPKAEKKEKIALLLFVFLRSIIIIIIIIFHSLSTLF